MNEGDGNLYKISLEIGGEGRFRIHENIHLICEGKPTLTLQYEILMARYGDLKTLSLYKRSFWMLKWFYTCKRIN
jgi:hypothetical protein